MQEVRAVRADLGRDKVSNGTRPFAGRVDLRSAAARRYRHLITTFTADIRGNPTELERGLIKQAAALTLKSEGVQAAIVAGQDDADPDAIIRLSSEIRRILTTLRGKAAQNKPAAPTILDFAAELAAETAEEAEA
jgi:hypothetical protein